MKIAKNQPKVQTERNESVEQVLRQQASVNKQASSSKVWEFFCSVKLAVVIILLMVVACILGTVILQERTFDEYTAKYGYFLATLFTTTQLNNVFYSYWFSFLLLLLCANLICCTIKRWKNSFLQAGFVLTHVSLILILMGGVIKFQLGVKGGVNVYEGKSVNYFLTQTMGRGGAVDYIKKDLPFTIALDRFILEKNEPKFQLVSYVKSKDRQKVLDTKYRKKQQIPGTEYKVTVKDYIPDVILKQEPVNISDKPDNPAVYVKLLSSKDAADVEWQLTDDPNPGENRSQDFQVEAEGWLIANDRNSYEDKNQDFRIEYIWLPSGDELDKTIAASGSVQPKLTAGVGGQLLEYPIEIDKVLTFEGTGYSVKILGFVFNYGDDRPLDKQPADNPAVQVEINGPEGPETRWIFEKFPDWDKMHPSKYKNLKLTCSGIGSVSTAKNMVKIIQSPEKCVIADIRDKHAENITPLKIGEKYPVANTKKLIMVSDYFPSFDLKEEVVKVSDEVGVPAILVEVEGPRGKLEDWLFSNNKYATWYPDNNFALLYESTGESIKHFVSELRIEENGKTVAAKAIKVNDPLKYKGYVIYQSSYDPEAGRFSGLQIVKDPGIPVAYAGFGALSFGVIFIFYVKPFLRKKQKKEVEE
ncbi:MAG: cytochrome c biogenesis protein ResB [Candidatus Loosdrechtia sp.]|uniref:cytochrome c biogenesis protein ResB n=1 Tax=Candidatus Loosdrechtia sp. TaxID=3101272 RepID=UPI003A6BD927|nr:MAG: cytochrome c biogenesis protein ResB [Candidatus Jettenia sp. AMX2]